jgi:glutamate-ammonia-ligase adenylyltransferase
VLRQNTGAALAALGRAGVLDADAAEELDRALALWRNVQGLLKLTVDEPFDEAAAPPALRAILTRGAGAIDFDRLKSDMSAAAEQVRACYAKLVARPASRARRRLGITEPALAEITEEETA